MIKENGLVVLTEEEHNDLLKQIRMAKMDAAIKDSDIDLLKVELATYKQSMKKLAAQNLKGKKGKKANGIEIPVGDFVDIIDGMTADWMDDPDAESKLQDLEATDLWFVWNGFSARIPYGCEICNTVLPAIKEAYEDYNS